MSQTDTTALCGLQADHTVLYQKLRAYHWTVKGQLFFGLHELFEKLYLEMAEAADELAERTLALGGTPYLTLADQLNNSSLKEDGELRSGSDMVKAVCEDLKALNAKMRAAVEGADPATANLLEGMADAREKTVWMLQAFLG